MAITSVADMYRELLTEEQRAQLGRVRGYLLPPAEEVPPGGCLLTDALVDELLTIEENGHA